MAVTGYKIAAIKYKGKFRFVACHKSNKCCALVAATNLSLLTGDTYVSDPHEDLGVLDTKDLAEDYALSVKESFVDPPSKASQSLLQHIEGKEDVLTSIARSLDASTTVLDPKNSSCKDFVETDVHSLFGILDIRVLHGWVLDPNDKDLTSIHGFSHSQMAARIAELVEANGDHHPLLQKLDGFRNTSITTQGMSRLKKEVKKGGLAILYSNNEYNILHNHCGDLFTLEASEEKRTRLPEAVWKKLSFEEDKIFYLTSDFTPTYGQPKEKLVLADEWFVRNLE